MQYEIENINGLDTIFADIKDSNSTTIQILVKAGSVYETQETNGISHFLEHTFFKGGNKYKTPQQVAEAIDQIGGDFNAFTGEEYAGYFVKSAPEFAGTSLEVLSDMLVNANFPEDEVQREKGVVLQEIKMYEDVPQRLVVDKWKNFFYGNNSYGRPILGTEENIQSFSTEDLRKHKQSLYTKDNMVLIVSGNLQNIENIKQKIGEYFKDLPEKSSMKKPPLPNQLPSTHKESYEKNTEQNHIVIGSKGYSIFDEERFAASLVGIILGGSMSSRLFQEIREKKGLCYYIGASHQSEQEDGIFMIRAGIEKNKSEWGTQKIFDEIEKIANGEIGEEEMNKALGFVKGKTKSGLETSEEIADFLGEQYLLKGEVKSIDEIIKEYEKLSLKDLQKVSSNLSKEKLYTYEIK